MKKAVFNGHTWLVAIVAVMLLGTIGIFGEYILAKLLIGKPTDEMKTLEVMGIPAIPYVVVQGITRIMDRLTYLPTKEGK